MNGTRPSFFDRNDLELSFQYVVTFAPTSCARKLSVKKSARRRALPKFHPEIILAFEEVFEIRREETWFLRVRSSRTTRYFGLLPTKTREMYCNVEEFAVGLQTIFLFRRMRACLS